jgi:hypothetical protein
MGEALRLVGSGVLVGILAHEPLRQVDGIQAAGVQRERRASSGGRMSCAGTGA